MSHQGYTVTVIPGTLFPASTWGLSWDHMRRAIGVLSFLEHETAREISEPQRRERQRGLQSSRWRSDVTEQ